MAREPTADFAVKARWVVPVEPRGEVLEDHAVLVRGAHIAGILPASRLDPEQVGEVIDRPDHALLPGLVNAHTHAAMTLLRNAGSGLALDEWLRGRIWPLEARLVDQQFVADGTEIAVAEMLSGGITCFADMYYYPEVAAQVAARAGMRAAIGLPVLEQPTAWAQDLDEYLTRGLELHDRYRGDPLVSTMFVLHSPSATGDTTLARVRTLADQLQAPVMTHLLESPAERTREERKHGRGPLQRLEAAGLLNDLLIAVHCVQVDMAEIGQLAAAGASVVHCPGSNLKLASGIAPVTAMREAGIRLALGTDGAASNDRLDLLGEMRLAAMLAAGSTGNATALSPAAVLEMATLGGASALGLGEATGSLVAGKWADMTCIRLQQPYVAAGGDVIGSILYAAGRADVSDTWVAGRHLYAEGHLRRISLADLRVRAAAWHRRVLAAAGLLG